MPVLPWTPQIWDDVKHLQKRNLSVDNILTALKTRYPAFNISRSQLSNDFAKLSSDPDYIPYRLRTQQSSRGKRQRTSSFDPRGKSPVQESTPAASDLLLLPSGRRISAPLNSSFSATQARCMVNRTFKTSEMSPLQHLQSVEDIHTSTADQPYPETSSMSRNHIQDYHTHEPIRTIVPSPNDVVFSYGPEIGRDGNSNTPMRATGSISERNHGTLPQDLLATQEPETAASSAFGAFDAKAPSVPSIPSLIACGRYENALLHQEVRTLSTDVVEMLEALNSPLGALSIQAHDIKSLCKLLRQTDSKDRAWIESSLEEIVNAQAKEHQEIVDTLRTIVKLNKSRDYITQSQ